MSVIPCEQNEALRQRIEDYAETLKIEAHKLVATTVTFRSKEFYNSGLFRGAIERIRGQFSATMRDKREFAKHVLNQYARPRSYIAIGIRPAKPTVMTIPCDFRLARSQSLN